MEFDDNVVVVTGASRGMGREIVHAFAARGAHVVVASRKLGMCEQVADTVRELYGVRAMPVACNVSHWSECDALIESVYQEFGRVDVLVSNAGLSPKYSSIAQVSEAYFDKVIGVNLKGPFRLAAAIGTRMADSGGGSIINVSSIEAVLPGSDAIPYAAAKAGLNSLTDGLAQLFGPSGVRVNAIQCGPFLTDISEAWTDERRARFETHAALRRCGRPDEVVGAALYFAGSASSYCTGAILRLDGGSR